MQHIDMTLPKNVPHQITARGSLLECQKMIGGDDPVIFSHVVLVLQSVPEVTAFIDQLIPSAPHSSTQLIVITDMSQKKKIMEHAPRYDYDKLATERRLRFIFKPLKPSKFAVIFDPGKEREMSTDRNQDSAQQVAITQKQVYEDLRTRLGNRGMRVLLVEDNRVNQMVSFLICGLVTLEKHADMLTGTAQIPQQSRDPGRDCTGWRTVHGESLCKATWLLLDHFGMFLLLHVLPGLAPSMH